MATQQNITDNTTNAPGLVAGHAEYIKGAAEVSLPD